MTTFSLRVFVVTGAFVALSIHPARAQPPAPTGLVPLVAGNLVQVSWNASAGAVNYIVQVGTAAGASNIFNAGIGNTTRAQGTIGPATYFWRVIAVDASGARSAPSAESQFTVGAGCVPPGPPQALSSTVAGLLVTLTWSPPASGSPPTNYVIEAGSASGLANLASLPTGTAATTFAVQAPPGRYFVRLRSQNACGTSGVSNEQVIAVGGGGQCSFAVAPPSINVPAAGGTILVNVTAPGGCRWQLQSDAFIVPTSTTGAGSATVQYSVGPAAVQRTGRITLVGLDLGPVTAPEVIVQQALASACLVTLNPSSQTVSAAGGTFDLQVTVNAGCAWSVTSLAGFITIVNPGSQNGSGTVSYQVAANSAQGSRAGVIRVTSPSGSQDLSITQQGTVALTPRFVMTQSGQDVTVCQVNQGPPCSLDASSSTPANAITAYEWRTVRFSTGGQDRTDNYTGVTAELDLPCTPGGNSQEVFDVTLTIRSADGQMASATRRLSLVRAGCGT